MNDIWIILETLIAEYAALHLRRFSQRSSQQTHSSCFTFSLLSVALLCEVCPWLFYQVLGLQLIAHWGKVWILTKVGPSCRKQLLKVRSASWSPLLSASCPKWIERPLSHVPAPQCPTHHKLASLLPMSEVWNLWKCALRSPLYLLGCLCQTCCQNKGKQSPNNTIY